MDNLPCNLCGGQAVEELSLRDREGHYLRTVICKGCGLVYSSPRPTPDQTREFYSQQYRVQYKGVTQPKKKHIYRAGRVALDRYARIRDILKPQAVILDVGSGAGEFLYVLRHLGFDARGIEPNEGYARYSIEAYGLPAQIGFVQDVEFPEGVFDVITLYHVLEHTEDPLGVFSQLRRWLKADGSLVVEVPNVEAVCQAPAHRYHVAHLHNFNQNTLETLGKKAGYEVHRTALSADGGNLLTVFQRAPPPPSVPGQITGNCERITHIIRRHTILAHYFSSYPYARPIRRIVLSITEIIGTQGLSTGKDILDRLLRRALQP